MAHATTNRYDHPGSPGVGRVTTSPFAPLAAATSRPLASCRCSHLGSLSGGPKNIRHGFHQRSNASCIICFWRAVPLISVSTESSPTLKWNASSMLIRFIVRTYGP